jgi:demethylmenaquinone methyltransferase / 2-methoxy-6-polyprenyl-1,4-benzoquinol methylase
MLATASGTSELWSMPIHEVTTEHSTLVPADRETKRAFVRGMFSAIAPRYDLLNHLLSLNIDRGWRRRAIGLLGWENAPRATYLDVCAGTLDVAVALAKQTGFAGQVVGADFAEPMLRAGLEKVTGRIAPVTADALDLPLATGSVAGAIVAFGIRNVSDLDAALREVCRVLADGARFVILEFTTPRNRVMRSFYHLYFHYVLPFVGGIVSGHRTAYRYLPASVAQFPAEEELASRMKAAGFVDVQWTSLSLGIAAIHVGRKR